MNQYNKGDKVIIDDESGVIESVVITEGKEPRYDVRYGHTFMIAVDVPEGDIQPWMADEQ